MRSHRTGSSQRAHCRRWAAWAALGLGWILPSAGCQVEYAGMTLPSGKYMHDDVQYFAPGPDFPWANTQAATQRARMQQMGIEPNAGPLIVPTPPGTLPPAQNQMGRPTDTSASPFAGEPIPPQPGQVAPAPNPVPGGAAPGAVPPPAGAVPMGEPAPPPQ